MLKKAITLSNWVDGLQSHGVYTFTREGALAAFKGKRIAVKRAADRLIQKGRLVIARRGFYVIVPLEYKSMGTPPADWFIDSLMKAQRHPYYVGLLSAAALHGAAHQQPQEFQVVTDTQMRPIRIGRVKIRFFYKKKVTATATTPVKTSTGMMEVSTPEATALDLVRYVKGVVGLDHVATVLQELSERIRPPQLLEAAKKETELSTVQRLGYLLDKFGTAHVADRMAKWVSAQKAPITPLRPEQNSKAHKKDLRWNLLINEKVDSDL